MRRYHLTTFGCQMNQHDSDRMAEVLREAGYEATASPSLADLLVLNTCSVREKAVQKLRSEVGRLASHKASRRGVVLALAGCLAQQEGESLLRAMPAVDLVVGPDNVRELPALLADIDAGGLPTVRTVFDLDAPRFLAAQPPVGTASPTAFVTIMKGCDERCSFCIVPTTRGPERYRPSPEVLGEIERLVEAGVREITLLGQTVDSYLDPSKALRVEQAGGHRGKGRDESQFPALLRAIAARSPRLARLRYTSPHPRHLTPALIAAHRDLPVLARHVHMPVQSGSDRVLRRMIRRYTVAEYEERTLALRDAVPGMTLSTDVIVGFPGETEEDFVATLELVRRVGFVSLFGFKYSQRPGTPAQKLGDDVPETEKAARLERLFERSEAQRREHLAGLVGTRQSVLVEGRGKGDTFSGRTDRNEIVHLACDRDPTGLVLDVTVRRAFAHSLEAEPVRLGSTGAETSRSGVARRALPVV